MSALFVFSLDLPSFAEENDKETNRSHVYTHPRFGKENVGVSKV